MIEDTVVALSTPAGTSALAVIRISGPEVKKLINQHLNAPSLSHSVMIHKNFYTTSGQIIDSLMYCYFEDPKSFTGEETLELYTHGNMLIVKSIIKELTSHDNVRLAEPGEFTRRAFQNGKIDLIQAESIGDMIHAKSESALKNARKLLTGKLSSKIHTLVEQVITLSAKMELDVDFAEEEADPDVENWSRELNSILITIDGLKSGYSKNLSANQKPSIVFYGKPNAGKSSLINALLEENRLLVSSKPGTTRDYIETQLFLPKGEVTLIDTAGLGVAVDELDKESQERSLNLINKAQHKVFIVDSNSKHISNEIEMNRDASIIVATKKDVSGFTNNSVITLSSITGEGIEELKSKISDLVFSDTTDDEDVWMASERQLDSLIEAERAIRKTLDQLEIDPAPELLAFELQLARNAMQSITGVISTDDILNSIFSSFCIGK